MIAPGLILDTPTRKLQVVLAAAGAIQCSVGYYDLTQDTKADSSLYRGACQFTTTNGTNEVDICPAPPQGVIRLINYICVYNSDAGAETVTIMVDDNTSNRIQVQMTLATTESMVWTPESGWNVIT